MILRHGLAPNEAGDANVGTGAASILDVCRSKLVVAVDLVSGLLRDEHMIVRHHQSLNITIDARARHVYRRHLGIVYRFRHYSVI
jgi:hypothetical protein